MPATLGGVARKFMLVAGDPSGDQLGAELVTELRSQVPGAEFFGAGGNCLESAGVELLFDLSRHSVIGLVEVLQKYFQLRRIFQALLAAAVRRRPEVYVGVDYGGFNLRFARALRVAAAATPDWRPKIVQFVSPQVWASRPARAQVLAENHHLLLSILPFEKSWYAQRTPNLRVEFVGHPLVDRHAGRVLASTPGGDDPGRETRPLVVILPGSRRGELRRHWPVLREAAARIAAALPVRLRAVLPSTELADLARQDGPVPDGLEICVGGLAESLSEAAMALASTGTVTLECAWFRVPTVAMYRTSWSTYEIGRRIISVPFLAMPNLLAGREVMPEFVQHAATPENLSRAAIGILQDPVRQADLRRQLGAVVANLGEPGACHRAAGHILSLLPETAGGILPSGATDEIPQ